ncbi:hypothetical protein [Hyalangium rubrum]|uniref:Uncharacterized protein n=1 Tax=Hyalangium rubrum TaxID=3103134 RepID=A0ABU5GWI4_9BACT|nr:hypothetical protein [Hyalangium sp. s54d21]MDY7225545.1 hypothetical protein [Hyalangium sp. s54d21]
MTTKKLIGVFASVALMSSGMALANGGEGKKHDTQQTQPQGSTGGSGSMGGSGTVTEGSASQMNQGAGQQLSSNELMGRVVKSSKKMVWVEHAGAVVPLTINKDTQFADPNLKRAQDFKEGDEIRASFEVRKTDNIATSIQKADNATGGSGLNQDTDLLPPAPVDQDTGGSGSDLTPPDIGDKGTSSDLGSDTGVDPGNKTGDY